MQTLTQKTEISRSMKRAFWTIGIFLTAVVVWLMIFVRIAVAHSEPPIDNRLFEKGKSYNDRFRALADGRAAGLQITSNLSDSQSFSLEPIDATFELKSSVPIKALEGNLVLERASTSVDRRRIPIDTADFKTRLNPGPGVWDLRLEYAVNGNLAVHRNIRITVK